MRMSDENLKILVIGSGGREHTIAKECAKSPRVDKVMVTPATGFQKGHYFFRFSGR